MAWPNGKRVTRCCRCGYLEDPARACSRAPRCTQDYQAKISGPLYDRIDLQVEVPAVAAADLSLPPPAENSAAIAERVAAARARQQERFADLESESRLRSNAEADGQLLEEIAAPDSQGGALLTEAAAKLRLSVRGYHRVLKVARTLADLEASAGRAAVAHRRGTELQALRARAGVKQWRRGKRRDATPAS